MRARSAVFILLSMTVAGCAVHGPNQVVTPTGPVDSASSGTVAAFKSAYDKAVQSDSASDAYQMVRVGSELEYQLCSSFFRSAGKEQQWLLFGKDALATIGTLTAGVLGAASASSTSIAWVAIASRERFRVCAASFSMEAATLSAWRPAPPERSAALKLNSGQSF